MHTYTITLDRCIHRGHALLLVRLVARPHARTRSLIPCIPEIWSAAFALISATEETTVSRQKDEA